MINISGITISDPNGDLNTVIVTVMNSGMTVLQTIPYSGQSIIQYEQPSAGTYYVKIVDGTSSESCELTKSITIEELFYIGSALNEYGGYSLLETQDGEYIIGGQFSSYNGNSVDNLVRINKNGSINDQFTYGDDNTFEISKIINGVNANTYLIGCNGRLYKIDNNGNLLTFNQPQYPQYYSNAWDVVKIDSYYILVCDNGSGNFSRMVEKILDDGSYDTTFNSGGNGLNGRGIPYSVYHDDVIDKIIVCGANFEQYNNININQNVFRLNLDGTLDDSFNTTISGISYARTIIRDDDNYIIAGGASYGTSKIYKISINGVVDTSFNSGGTGFDGGYVTKVIKDHNGKYVCIGSFTSYNGTNCGGIVRLNSNGSVDTTFNSGGSGFSYNAPRDIIEDEYNRYLIVGSFISYNDQSLYSSTNYSYGIIRLNYDGSVNM